MITASANQLLAALNRLTETAVAAPGPGAIYEAALDAIVETLDADRAAVLLFDPDGVIRFKASRGLSATYMAEVEGHSPWAQDEPAAKPVLVADVIDAPDLAHLKDPILAEGIRAVAFVPLVYADRLLGKFMAYFGAPHVFSDDELEFARTVAAQIAFALEQRRLDDELRLANEQLAATLDAVGEGIMVRSPAGEMLFANTAAAQLLGFGNPEELMAASTDEILSRFEVVDAAGGPVDAAAFPGRKALAGENPPEALLRYRVLATGAEKLSAVKATPVFEPTGTVRFAVTVLRDVTDREGVLAALRRSQGRLELLASATPKLLAASLDDRTVLDTVADVVVPSLADACTIWELTDAGAVDPAVTRPDAAGAASALSPDVVAEAIRSRRSLRVRDDDQSVIVAPLEARGRPLGGVTLVRTRPPYDDADVTLVEDLAGRAALAIDNARLFSDRSRVAETLQKALLPPRLPDIPGLDLAARYHPAASEVGGDFYDVIGIGPGRWMFVVGDVCGKGIDAASLTAVARSTVQALSLEHEHPSELLRAMNAVLLRQLAPERFCAMACVLVDATGPDPRMTLALAGQPRPLVVSRAGDVSLVGYHGTVLGILPVVDVVEEDLTLGAGDSLVVYTDGCLGGAPGGGAEENLATVVAHDVRTTLSGLAASVESAGQSAGDADDVTVLALRVTGF